MKDRDMGYDVPLMKWFFALSYGGIGVALLVNALRDGSFGLVLFAGIFYLAVAASWAFRGFRQNRKMIDTDETTVE